MTSALNLLKKAYLENIKESPEIYIGVELEFPIVHREGKATDTGVTKGLIAYLAEQFDFLVEEYDWDGNPIQLINKDGDRILFEVSYNTLEFAFARAKTIQEVEYRFNNYMGSIQPYLRAKKHEIQGVGVHPQWALNDNRAVRLPRYQMLLKYLALSKKQQSSFFHSFPQYGSFICGNQVQLDVSRSNYLRVINAFNKIESVKAVLFANSEFSGEDWDTKIARDLFWEHSMHGLLEENVGVYAQAFRSEAEFFNNLSQTALFTAERNGKSLYFEPIKVCDYLEKQAILAYDLKGHQTVIKPQKEDFQLHRSYQYQDLTRRGTVEFRSVCTQPLNSTFAPIAFHLGLFENLKELEKILEEHPFLSSYRHDYKGLRRRFSKKTVRDADWKAIQSFSKSVLSCAMTGLQKRQKGEESYLLPLVSKFLD